MSLLSLSEQKQLDSVFKMAINQSRQSKKSVLAGIQIPFFAFRTLDLFTAPSRYKTLLWELPNTGQSILGIGSAVELIKSGENRFHDCINASKELFRNAVLTGFEEIAERRPILLGGFAFNHTSSTNNSDWEGFYPAQLNLPEFLFVKERDICYLSIFHLILPNTQLEKIKLQVKRRIDWLEERLSSAVAATTNASNGNPFSLNHSRSSQNQYIQAAHAAIDAIGKGKLEKVVLARSCQVESTIPFNQSLIIEKLRESYPSCFVFAVANSNATFIGASPERLLSLKNGTVYSGPLAGSIGRGKTPQEDIELAASLIESDKEQREHAIVVEAIHSVLRTFCDNLKVPSNPSVLRLHNLQHLYTPIEGRTKLGYTYDILDILGHLHPTPAVAGIPRDKALAWIRNFENLDRGWYTGTIGWVNDRGEGDFAIALRSALIRKNKALIHAGSGFVSGSEIENELAETNLKMRASLEALLSS